jgi:hypothetical protein
MAPAERAAGNWLGRGRYPRVGQETEALTARVFEEFTRVAAWFIGGSEVSAAAD